MKCLMVCTMLLALVSGCSDQPGNSVESEPAQQPSSLVPFCSVPAGAPLESAVAALKAEGIRSATVGGDGNVDILVPTSRLDDAKRILDLNTKKESYKVKYKRP